MVVVLKDTQGVKLAIQPVSKAGNPAPVENFTVESLHPELVRAVLDPANPLAFSVEAVGPVGLGQVRVTADADLGEGVKIVSGVLDVEIQAGEAFSLTPVLLGAPYEQS